MPCGALIHSVVSPDELSRLTPRERELLGYFARGQSNKVVAIDFGISLRTAEAHRARILRKLGVRTTMELACTLCPYRAGDDIAN